jgi:hypothetical protein
MNERILDICIKAGINTWPFNEVGFISLDESELEKFAELIVKECAEICMMEFDTGLLMAPQAPWIAKQIKEHFGVEE